MIDLKTHVDSALQNGERVQGFIQSANNRLNSNIVYYLQ